MGLPQATKFNRIREHITMLGRHYATGHPSVNPRFKNAQEEREFNQKYNDVIAFGSWFENNFEKFLFANPENGLDLFESYLWVWEVVYNDQQAKEGLRKLQDVVNKFKNVTGKLRQDYNKLNLPLNPILLKLETKILQGRTAALQRQTGASEDPDISAGVQKPKAVYCDECGKPIEDISKSKRCRKCGRVYHHKGYGTDCGFPYSDATECNWCRKQVQQREFKKEKSSGISASIFCIIVGVVFMATGVLAAPGVMLVLLGVGGLIYIPIKFSRKID